MFFIRLSVTSHHIVIFPNYQYCLLIEFHSKRNALTVSISEQTPSGIVKELSDCGIVRTRDIMSLRNCFDIPRHVGSTSYA